MKYLITILLFLISFISNGQFTPDQTIGVKTNRVRTLGAFQSDSGIIVSNLDTLLINRLNYYDGLSGKGSGLVFYSNSYYMRYNGQWVKLTNQTDINNIFGCYRLLNGGLVTWDSLLIFHIQPATYIINCKSYTSRDTTLVLSAADSTNPRRDVIAVDTLGRAVVVEGTPSADPAKPQVDLGSQIELTDILVAAGATTPSGVSRTIIYDENLGSPSEWVGSSDIGGGFGTADFNNTSFPYTGVKSASITSAVPMETKYVKFNNGSSVSLTDYQTLSFAIKLKAAILNNAVLSVGLLNGGNYVGNFVNLFNYGLNGGNTNYQVITIPIVDFLGGSFSFDEVRFNLKRSGSGFYLDRVQLEGGITSPSNNNFITDIFRKVGTDSVFKVINGNISFAFRDSIGITSIPTWQQTLNVTNGKQLTSNTTIDLNSHDFIWSENNKYEIRDGGGNLNFLIQPATNQAGIGDLDFLTTGTQVLVDWGVDSVYYDAFKHRFNGSVRMPSVAASISTDTLFDKPIVGDLAGNLKRSAYWYGSGGSQTLNQILRYGNIGDTAVYLTDSLQAQKLDINKGGIGLGGYKYSTALPIGTGSAVVKDSIVVFGASYETTAPPISSISYIDLVASNLNTTVYRFAISGTGFQLGTANSFMSRLSAVPTYRTTLRYIFIGGSNILNDYQYHIGHTGLATAIQSAVDTIHIAKGWPLDRIILTTNPQTGAFGTNTIDTARIYSIEAVKGAKAAGIRYVNTYEYMSDNGGTATFMGSDSIHAITSGHYAISDAVLKSGVSSIVTTDGIKILKGGINIQDNATINFTSYNTTSSNRILTWDNGATNNRSGLGKINTYGLGIFAPFAGDGIYAGLGQDATTLNSTTAHWYLSGITTARLMSFNSSLFFNANDWTIKWTPDAAARNKILLSDWGATDQKIGIGTTSDGKGGLSLFSQNYYYGGGDVLIGSGYDASNMTRANAGLIVKPSNRVTVRDILSIGNKLIVGDTAIGNIDASALFQLSSTTQGFILSRMTSSQKTSISSPSRALMVFDTSLNNPSIFDGVNWNDLPLVQQSRVSTQFDKTSSITLSDITGLTANVAAGRTYRFEAILYTSSAITGGVKVAIGGTATATNIIYEAEVHQGGLTVVTGTQRATALATTVGDVTAVTTAKVKITGTITVNAAGTLTVQFAQNASDGTASSVLVGSNFIITQIL